MVVINLVVVWVIEQMTMEKDDNAGKSQVSNSPTKVRKTITDQLIAPAPIIILFYTSEPPHLHFETFTKMIILTGPNNHPDSNEHHGGEEGRLGRVQGQAGDHSQGANILLGLIFLLNI